MRTTRYDKRQCSKPAAKNRNGDTYTVSSSPHYLPNRSSKGLTGCQRKACSREMWHRQQVFAWSSGDLQSGLTNSCDSMMGWVFLTWMMGIKKDYNCTSEQFCNQVNASCGVTQACGIMFRHTWTRTHRNLI